MDKTLEKRISHYIPPQVLKALVSNNDKYIIAKYVLDREYKKYPHKWKTSAYPEYEDFFQAAFIGYNPYKDTPGKEKGIIQSIENYNPHRDSTILLEIIGDVEQAVCPCCKQRGEAVSLWSVGAGNQSLTIEFAPESIYQNGNKYCGKEIKQTDENLLKQWEEKQLVRRVGNRYFCNHLHRLSSLRNHISRQISFLIHDVRIAEFSSYRSLKRHPHYICPHCNVLTKETKINKGATINCKCGKPFASKNCEKIWVSYGSNTTISINSPISSEKEGRATYEEIIPSYSCSIHNTTSLPIDSVVIEEKRTALFEKLVDRIRFLSANSIEEKQYEKLFNDVNIPKDKRGVPETLPFQIFYNYFFTDDIEKKRAMKGKIKNAGDESSSYAKLALKYLKKEQHYSQCKHCCHKMYEPIEKAIIKKIGLKKQCESCGSLDVIYHGPKCKCGEHKDVDIVMYIFQTIEPKIRKVEKLVKEDKRAWAIFQEIKEINQLRDQIRSSDENVRLLNY